MTTNTPQSAFADEILNTIRFYTLDSLMAHSGGVLKPDTIHTIAQEIKERITALFAEKCYLIEIVWDDRIEQEKNQEQEKEQDETKNEQDGT